MDEADYRAIRARLDAQVDTVMRLRAQWSTLPEPTMWSGPAHLAALVQIRQGPEKLAGIGTHVECAIDECNERIEQAHRDAELQHRALSIW